MCEDALPQSQKVRATLRLYGVLVHAGSTPNSGHYYCYVKARTGSWYKMDDSSVERVQWQTVQQETAYMLFYLNEAGQLLGKQPRGATSAASAGGAKAGGGGMASDAADGGDIARAGGAGGAAAGGKADDRNGCRCWCRCRCWSWS